jgi:putative hydrolase of the HAD superfamily
MFDAYIFDLDLCICNTYSMTGPFFDPVLALLRAADIDDGTKVRAEEALWSSSLEDVATRYALPDGLVEDMRAAYRRIEVPDSVRSYGDEGAIRLLPGKKFLVTSGYRTFQESKIEKLRIRQLFDGIYVDATDDPKKRPGKRRIFADLLAEHRWAPVKVLVVGDNPHSELSAGRALGMKTAQTERPNVARWNDADYHIDSLHELSFL